MACEHLTAIMKLPSQNQMPNSVDTEPMILLSSSNHCRPDCRLAVGLVPELLPLTIKEPPRPLPDELSNRLGPVAGGADGSIWDPNVDGRGSPCRQRRGAHQHSDHHELELGGIIIDLLGPESRRDAECLVPVLQVAVRYSDILVLEALR